MQVVQLHLASLPLLWRNLHYNDTLLSNVLSWFFFLYSSPKSHPPSIPNLAFTGSELLQALEKTLAMQWKVQQ